MKHIIDFIRKLRCKHEYKFYSNIYGDDINYLNARSIFVCKHCKKADYRKDLVDETHHRYR